MTDDNGNIKPGNGLPESPQNNQPVTGRPRIEVSIESFEALCSLQCTLAEIAAVMNVSEDTIERRCVEWYQKRFAEVFREKRQIGFVSLRRTLWKMMATEPSVARHLASYYLGIKEKVDISVSADIRIMQEFMVKGFKDVTTEQLRRIRNGEPVERVLLGRDN